MSNSIGAVNLTIATGAVAQVSVASGRRPLAIIGPCQAGSINIPTPVSRKSTVLSTFVRGPTVEAAAYALAYEVPKLLMVRTDTSGGTAGAYGSITVDSADGTVTGDGTVKPDDDFEVIVEVLTGFTVGTTGGAYRYSLDDGRSYSGSIALGTALFIQLPYGGGKYVLTSTDVWLVGESFSLHTTAPRWSSAALVTAIEALRDSTLPFGTIEIVGPFATLGEVQAVHAAVLDLRTKVKYAQAIGHFRARTSSETAAAYAAAFNTAFSLADCGTVSLTPSWYAPSAIAPGAIYVRPYSFHAAARTAKLRQDISASSRTEFGSGTGQIRGSDGLVLQRSVDEFDQELFTPFRGFAQRTWPDKGDGQIFASQGLTLAADGSDVANLRVAQVLNLAAETAYGPLADRVGRGLLPAPDNTLDPTEKQRIEEQVGAVLEAAMVRTGIAVGARLVLDPGQVVIGTPPIRITGTVLVRIKGYADEFSVEIAVDATPS